MRRRLRQSKEADKDLDNIWNYTAKVYGIEQAESYSSIIKQALRDIEQNPLRPTSRAEPDLGQDVRSYRIALSKGRSGSTVKSPRHVVIYTLQFKDEIFVMRILHDAMDVVRHLPET